MTQMLLFDSPTIPAEANLLTVTGAVAADTEDAAGEARVAAQLEQESGLHHMGDLARLVLLRYDLMAKRRAQRAGRR